MPGPFLTDISEAWDLDAFNERVQATYALQRGGQPEEVIGAALDFASAASEPPAPSSPSTGWRRHREVAGAASSSARSAQSLVPSA